MRKSNFRMVDKDKDIISLEEKIRAATVAKSGQAAKASSSKDKGDDANMKAGMHAGMEFVGAIFLPTFVGYWIDQWLGTFPAFFIGLFFLGIFTGFYNIWRVMNNLGTGVGYSPLHEEEKDAKSSADLSESEQNDDKNKE